MDIQHQIIIGYSSTCSDRDVRHLISSQYPFYSRWRGNLHAHPKMRTGIENNIDSTDYGNINGKHNGNRVTEHHQICKRISTLA